MPRVIEVRVPDMGNFKDVAVIDVLVKPGDAIEVDGPLVTLETDKASMDVPAAAAGRISEVLLKRGDKVSKGSLIARVEAGAGAGASPAPAAPATAATAAPGADARAPVPRASVRADATGDTVRMPSPLARRPGEGATDAARSTHPDRACRFSHLTFPQVADTRLRCSMRRDWSRPGRL